MKPPFPSIQSCAKGLLNSLIFKRCNRFQQTRSNPEDLTFANTILVKI
jgi:hypothetical protein